MLSIFCKRGTKINSSQLSNFNLVIYANFAFFLAFIGLPIYIYLPNYFHDNFGISLQTIAVILLITRFIDAFQDLFFGIISDYLQQYKKELIVVLAPFLGLSLWLLFNPVAVVSIELWLTLFLITTYSLYSFININYQSYAVTATSNYRLKTTIISYREGFSTFGVICAVVIPIALNQWMNPVTAYWYIGAGYFVLLSISALLFYLFVFQVNFKPAQMQSMLQTLQWRKAIKKRLVRKYYYVFFFNAIASAVPAVLIIFFVERVLKAENYLGVFLLVYFLGLLTGVPFWTKMSQILNNKPLTFIYSMLFSVSIFSICFWLNQGDIALYVFICLFSGFGFGGDLVLSYSILTDIIQKYQLEKISTTLFAICNFLIKFALTIASASLIYMIGFLEFEPLIQINFIYYSYIAIPIIFRLLATVLMYYFFEKNSLLLGRDGRI